MIVGLSVIVPTTDRWTLRRTLESTTSQMEPMDEIIVVFDGMYDMQPTVDYLRAVECDWQVARIRNLGAYGHGARNFALDHIVTRPRVVSIDDDDVFLPGAFVTIRREVAAHPPAVHIFGAKWGAGHPASGTVLPRGFGLQRGEIATPMIVAPTCTARFGTDVDAEFAELGPGYFGDFEYACQLAQIFGDFVWHDDVIAEIRPAVVQVPA